MRRPIARDQNQRKRVPGSSVSAWANFNPMLLKPFLWLDASDASTITESSNAVSQWNDKSGNGRNFVQASGTAQPTTGTTSQNELNVIVFDGTTDVMTFTGSFTLSRFFTYAFVCTPSTGSDDYLFWCFAGPPTNVQWAVISKYLSRAYEFYQAGSGSGSARLTLGATGATGFNTNIVSHRSNDVTSLVNGAPSGSSAVGATSDQTMASISVGAAGSSNFSGTNFAELLIFDTSLANQDLQILSNYLRRKWATP